MKNNIIRFHRKKQPEYDNHLSARENSQRANRTILRRTRLLMVIFGVLLFIPLIAKLYQLMIVDHDKYEAMAIQNQTRSTNVSASRGMIYDRNMNILASSKTVETVFIDPNEIATQMEKPENSNLLDTITKGLSSILDVDADFIYEQAADTKYRYKVIVRKIEEDLADEVREFISESEIKGVYLETDEQRYYPYSNLCSQLIGFVSSDNIGSEGIEAVYDETLTGNAGKVVTTKGNYGSEMLYTYEKYYDAADGDSLVLTIDTGVQEMLESNLEAAIEKYEIRNGAFGIVMDVNTGEILGMANVGGYDLNNYLEIYNTQLNTELEEMYQRALLLPEGSDAYNLAMTEYNNAVASARLKQWRNRCVSDGYEPGSTFKLVTLASALDSGAVTVNDAFYCGGHEDFAGREQTVSCWKLSGHGEQTTSQALGNSCNIAFSHIALRMGGETFYQYIKDFGFMAQTNIDLPGESSGIFFGYNLYTSASTASLISSSFGQTFKVTPIQQVRAIAAIVNGGYLLQPYVVQEVIDSEGNTVNKAEPQVLRQVISEETSAIMRQMMEEVVTLGTASSAYTPGYRVGGKTGTSEKIDEFDENGNLVEDKIVSFVGVAPIDDPKYVVLVALDTPDYIQGTSYTPHNQYISGGLMAAPTVRDIFLDILPYLGVEPDYSAEDISGVNFVVPDLVGKSEAEAAELLSKKTLTYRIVGSGSTVTDQLPTPGKEIPGKSEVILYMGGERPMGKVEVPDFLDRSYADVLYLAEEADLYVQTKGTGDNGWVMASYQDIAAGTMVERGTTITVEFASGGVSD